MSENASLVRGELKDGVFGIKNDWEKLISLGNFYRAWQDFSVGKLRKRDVIIFAHNIENELLALRADLARGSYHHGGYQKFTVHDPKERVIHKASVRDRVVHRLVYNHLLPLFNRGWLDCSFSCRPGYGQFKSINAVEKAMRQITANYTKSAWAVKSDVKKFFNSINHDILYRLLCRKVGDEKIRFLLLTIIQSFKITPGVGVPIGNLTSQIFANVYLHGLDVFSKHQLKQRYYFRYADDFICLIITRNEAEEFVVNARQYLAGALRLELHPRKIIFRASNWGIDWLGEVLLPGFRLLRPSTRRRVIKKIAQAVRDNLPEEKIAGMLSSYNGLIKPVAHKSITNGILQSVALYYQL